jgi:hypothetical protein
MDDILRFDQIFAFRFRKTNGRANQSEVEFEGQQTDRERKRCSLRELIECHSHVEHLFDSMAEIIEMLEDLLVFGHENAVRLSRLISRLTRIGEISNAKAREQTTFPFNGY